MLDKGRGNYTLKKFWLKIKLSPLLHSQLSPMLTKMKDDADANDINDVGAYIADFVDVGAIVRVNAVTQESYTRKSLRAFPRLTWTDPFLDV